MQKSLHESIIINYLGGLHVAADLLLLFI